MMNEFKTLIDTYSDDDMNFWEMCEPWNINPVFVIGAPRSRTTVLWRCLSEHPQISWLEKETMFLLHMFDMYKNLYKWGYGTFGNIMTDHEILYTIRKFSDSIITKIIGDQWWKHFFCDHTPWYGNITPFIKALYPNSKFIHIVRDEKEVVESLAWSYESGKKWAWKNDKERSNLWSNMVKNCRRENKNPNYLEVQSQDLIENPEYLFRQILWFIDIYFDSIVLSRLKEKHVQNWVQNRIKEIII